MPGRDAIVRAERVDGRDPLAVDEGAILAVQVRYCPGLVIPFEHQVLAGKPGVFGIAELVNTGTTEGVAGAIQVERASFSIRGMNQQLAGLEYLDGSGHKDSLAENELGERHAKIELRFRMRIHLYYVGRPRDASANRMAEEYLRRSTRYGKCEMREIVPARFDPWKKHPSATKILLDPAGKSMASKEFAKLIERAEQEARDLVFLVGDADGLPEGWRVQGGMLLSLTPLTLPHELARVVLAEQIYRAFTMLRGHPYPK